MSKFMSFFATAIEDEWGGITYQPTMAGYTALVALMLLAVLLGCFIFGSKKKFNARELAFASIAIALAVVSSTFLKLFHMPMGGSVTLFSMLFIVLIGYWYGIGAGLTAAVAYGVLQLVIDPYIISIPQMLVDYIFAFGALGLSGIFAKLKIRDRNIQISFNVEEHTAWSFKLYFGKLHIAYIVAVLGRYAFATLSGVIFFGQWAPEEFPNPLVYSLAYNGAYLGVEALITLAVLSIPPVYKALKYVKGLATK